jgi:hypothetical protein
VLLLPVVELLVFVPLLEDVLVLVLLLLLLVEVPLVVLVLADVLPRFAELLDVLFVPTSSDSGAPTV